MKITNRRAYHKYQILDKFEAGIKLTGPEVKSVKNGRIRLERAFVKIKGSEAYLINAHIPPYPYARQVGYDPNRSRKLLLHKKEIIALKTKIEQKNLTIVPLSCYTTTRKRVVQGSDRRSGSYTKRGLVKLELALAKGQKRWQKKRVKKRKDIEREIERELKEKIQ